MQIGKKEFKDFKELMIFLCKGTFYILGFSLLVVVAYLFLFSFRQEDQMGAFKDLLNVMFRG